MKSSKYIIFSKRILLLQTCSRIFESMSNFYNKHVFVELNNNLWHSTIGSNGSRSVFFWWVFFYIIHIRVIKFLKTSILDWRRTKFPHIDNIMRWNVLVIHVYFHVLRIRRKSNQRIRRTERCDISYWMVYITAWNSTNAANCSVDFPTASSNSGHRKSDVLPICVR